MIFTGKNLIDAGFADLARNTRDSGYLGLVVVPNFAAGTLPAIGVRSGDDLSPDQKALLAYARENGYPVANEGGQTVPQILVYFEVLEQAPTVSVPTKVGIQWKENDVRSHGYFVVKTSSTPRWTSVVVPRD